MPYKEILINSIVLNSCQKRKSNCVVHLDCVCCIIKYIPARRKLLFCLSINGNQFNLCKNWEHFSQINFCFHVFYTLILLLSEPPLPVKLFHVEMHPPNLHLRGVVQWAAIFIVDISPTEFFMEVTTSHYIPLNLN